MRKFLLSLLFFVLVNASHGQEISVDSLYQLAAQDLTSFSNYLIAGAETEQEKAEKIIDWLARHFDWTATDYQKRSLTEIIERKGGNCAELARVAAAAFEEVDLKMRRVREINLHVKTDRRQVSAEAKVREMGNRASVFGR